MNKTIQLFLLFFVILISSCASGFDNCMDNLIDEEGYSYDEAKELCEDAEYESMIR